MKRFQTARTFQRVDRLVHRCRVDRNEKGDRSAVRRQDGFALAREGVANLSWTRSEVANGNGFRGTNVHA